MAEGYRLSYQDWVTRNLETETPEQAYALAVQLALEHHVTVTIEREGERTIMLNTSRMSA